MRIAIAVVCWMMGGAAFQEKAGNEEDRITVVLDAAKKIQMEFVRIRAGKFTMGDKDDRNAIPHEVTLTKDYWMQTTETTQAQWATVMGKNPSEFKGADLPVESVSWEDCQEFLKRLNEKMKDHLKGKAAGLPTEAQWEYACRAGEKGKWCFGDDEKMLGDYAWYRENSDEKTHPVGQKKQNAWGLHDVHGNVWEWCEDWCDEKYPSEAMKDPTGPTKGGARGSRGGCWRSSDVYTGSAIRGSYRPAGRCDFGGLRVALHSPATEGPKK